jgi:hypothetical protein
VAPALIVTASQKKITSGQGLSCLSNRNDFGCQRYLMASQKVRYGHRHSAYLIDLTLEPLAASDFLREHHILRDHQFYSERVGKTRWMALQKSVRPSA